MPPKPIHIPFLDSITEFFKVYGIGEPLNPEIMCMKLQDQPDERLLYMPLYRANFYRVLHFTQVDIQSIEKEIKRNIPHNCLVFSYPSKLESWERRGKLYGNVIYFSANFASIDITKRNYELEYPFFSNESEQILPLTDQESVELNKLSGEMIEEIYSNNGDKLELIKILLALYLHKIRRIYNRNLEKYSLQTKMDKSLFYRFRQEIDLYFLQLAAQQKTTSPSVALFAEVLNVNPNNLNTTIKKQTGKTASSFIQEKMLLEAKSYLIHTNLQIAEVAYCLGFENLSYFNRFFKKHAHSTPLEYRHRGKSDIEL
ncbi:MAG: helix-turn-helix domain-containing protein [Bacteroidota bacterium]